MTSKHLFSMVLIAIWVSAFKFSPAQTFSVSDTVFVFDQNRYDKGIISEIDSKTAVVSLNGEAKTVKIKNLYTPYPTPANVKCRHFDNVVTDDVIVDATALGFNKKYILVEFNYNRETLVAVKHESEMVQSLKRNK